MLALIMFIIGCSNEQENSDTLELNIAYQYGLAYAPFEIMKENKILEEKLNGVKINWHLMSSGGAMNEGIISGDLDIALMGAAPFLIGFDKGIDYKVISSIASQKISLVTNDSNLNDLSKFTITDKIALPSVGSIQHLALAMAAKEQLGDSKALDMNLVNMSTPEAYQAVASKQEVKAHMATPPYSNLSLETEGHQLVLDSTKYLGKDASVIIAVGGTKLKENNPEVYEAVNEALTETIESMYTNIDETVKILAEKEGLEEADMKRYLESDHIKYQQEVKGLIELANFMKEEGYISKVDSEDLYIFSK